MVVVLDASGRFWESKDIYHSFIYTRDCNAWLEYIYYQYFWYNRTKNEQLLGFLQVGVTWEQQAIVTLRKTKQKLISFTIILRFTN